MKTKEAVTEATDPTGANKAVAESLIEVPNKGEGASKIIIGGNTKANVGNLTPLTEAITIIIITVNYQGRGGHGCGGNNYRGHG